ncbi:MAG: sugar-binding protein [Butyrivibrio sp.]|nr:sugar-binding protein [Butyrivibrio sp.]
MKKINFITITIIINLLLSSCASTPMANEIGTNTVAQKPSATAEEAPQSYEQSSANARIDDGRTVVGISMPDKLLERWNHDGIFLKEHFEKEGCEVILKYADNLIDTQISDIRSMIDGGADLLVITAVDGAALSSVLDKAKSQGIKIIAYDRLLMNSPSVDYYVSYDNYKVGVLQAEYVISALRLEKSSQTKTIEFVTGDPVDNNARYFYQGAVDTLMPYLESGKLSVLSNQQGFYETSTAQWSTDIAQQRLQIILNSYYPENVRLDAVLCANDSTALGATRALESDYNGQNSVVVTGQDADVANIYSIIEGKQSMTVFKALRDESVVAVALGLSILSDETPDAELITRSGWKFECSYNTTDYDNGSKIIPSYLLSPITITKDNLEKELFDTGYYARNGSGLIYAVE